MDTNKFWKTQPIDISKNLFENKSIENIDINTVRKEPIILQEPKIFLFNDIPNYLKL